ncbi:MAG: hypothetical protein GX591_20565 [Planctomycetes bacterium]|nr:hypothetical protein [Planctomycetota bacterium]
MAWWIPIIGCCCTRVYKLTPCYEPGVTCESYESTCGRPAPKYWTAVVAGTSPVAGCVSCGAPYTVASGRWLSAPTVDGTYLLTGGACSWGSGILAASGSFGVGWVDASCTNARTYNIDSKYVSLQWNNIAGKIGFYIRTDGSEIVWAQCLQFAALQDIAVARCRTITFTQWYYECRVHLGDYPNAAFSGFTGGTAIVYAGDIYQAAGTTACPGGDPIYTHAAVGAALGSHVGGVVQLDDGIWYEVEIDTEGHASAGVVTVVDTGDSCAEVCAA